MQLRSRQSSSTDNVRYVAVVTIDGQMQWDSGSRGWEQFRTVEWLSRASKGGSHLQPGADGDPPCLVAVFPSRIRPDKRVAVWDERACLAGTSRVRDAFYVAPRSAC